MPSSPPPDRFQREIDDIIRLAERRLEHQSFGYRVRRSTRRLGNAFGRIHIGLPPPEVLGGWAMALLLIGWLLTLPIVSGMLIARVLVQPVFVIGIALLVLAIVSSLMRGRSGSRSGMWRGERVSYGNPYSESWLGKLRRMFRGDR
ncbi:MAG TPA: hypothetical protein VGJ60_04320 [Chloroflexota bacterium]|jgi:hypothetical protein